MQKILKVSAVATLAITFQGCNSSDDKPDAKTTQQANLRTLAQKEANQVVDVVSQEVTKLMQSRNFKAATSKVRALAQQYADPDAIELKSKQLLKGIHQMEHSAEDNGSKWVNESYRELTDYLQTESKNWDQQAHGGLKTLITGTQSTIEEQFAKNQPIVVETAENVNKVIKEYTGADFKGGERVAEALKIVQKAIGKLPAYGMKAQQAADLYHVDHLLSKEMKDQIAAKGFTIDAFQNAIKDALHSGLSSLDETWKDYTASAKELATEGRNLVSQNRNA
jgi:hypothetical protein